MITKVWSYKTVVLDYWQRAGQERLIALSLIEGHRPIRLH